jgi:hypothetical protein
MSAVFGIIGSAVDAQKSGDGCALLQATEIQALAGTVKVGAGKVGTGALDSRTCEYEWGTGGNVQSGRSFLNVIVPPLSKAFPGTDASVVRQGLLAAAKAGKANTAVIPDIGDAATYESNDPIPGEGDRSGEREHGDCLVRVVGRTREEGPGHCFVEGGCGASVTAAQHAARNV